jgi:radical SAM protein with 4Fe4S-binding SPASM domain
MSEKGVDPLGDRQPDHIGDEFQHYSGSNGPVHEFDGLDETPPSIRNIGWTLGNECPYRCTHCYSMNARRKGRNMSVDMIDRIVEQLVAVGVETVNLGGNEPIFTNGPNPKDSLLPYIIRKLHAHGIAVGLTTSGVSLTVLHRDHREAFELLNDVDVSLDSPYREEHNANRGANTYDHALRALEICRTEGKVHSVIMCAMNWNFSIDRIERLVDIARTYEANVRINPLKPVLRSHMAAALPAEMYFAGFERLMNLCVPIDLGEPPLAAMSDFQKARRCPCGRTSFRIHSITPNGQVFVSPCVYLHDYKSSLDLLKHDLVEIIRSPEFRVFRMRNANPEHVEGCRGCAKLAQCGGGCVARSYLYSLHQTGVRTMRSKDPYCPVENSSGTSFPLRPAIRDSQRLVHMDYLCTWIGSPT